MKAHTELDKLQLFCDWFGRVSSIIELTLEHREKRVRPIQHFDRLNVIEDEVGWKTVELLISMLK